MPFRTLLKPLLMAWMLAAAASVRAADPPVRAGTAAAARSPSNTPPPFGAAPSPFAPAPVTRLPRLADQVAASSAGLRAATDSSPVCRGGCADRRYVCGTQADDAPCSTAYTRCVLACRPGR